MTPASTSLNKHAVAKEALNTLVEITPHVYSDTFSLERLARNFHRSIGSLQQEVEWLTREGYIELAPNSLSSFRLTRKGKSFEESNENDESGEDD